MTAEEIHIKKLKEIGYKDEPIKELVKQFHSQQKYLFAEDIHQEKLKLLGIGVVSNRRELLIATLYGWQDYNEQGISIEDYVDEIESNL
jgi:hypothetical protein